MRVEEKISLKEVDAVTHMIGRKVGDLI